MNEIKINNTMFNDIKHIDEMGNEYWLARELMPLLEYSKWENFYKVIQKAINACKIVIITLMNIFLTSGKR